MSGEWIELRCDGKLHGRLAPGSLTLVTARGDWIYIYDLPATVREGRPIVTRLRAEEYSTTPPHLNGEALCVTGHSGG